MKQLILGAALIGIGTVIGALSSNTTNGTANALDERHPIDCVMRPPKF